MKWWDDFKESNAGAFTIITVRHGYKVALLGTVMHFASQWFSYLYRDELEVVKLLRDLDYWVIAILLIYFVGVMIVELVKEDFFKNGENNTPSVFLAY